MTNRNGRTGPQRNGHWPSEADEKEGRRWVKTPKSATHTVDGKRRMMAVPFTTFFFVWEEILYLRWRWRPPLVVHLDHLFAASPSRRRSNRANPKFGEASQKKCDSTTLGAAVPDESVGAGRRSNQVSRNGGQK